MTGCRIREPVGPGSSPCGGLGTRAVAVAVRVLFARTDRMGESATAGCSHQEGRSDRLNYGA